MTLELDDTDRALLNGFQRDFPLVTRPYEKIGAALGVSEREAIDRLSRLKTDSAVSRVGATVETGTVGASCLVAMAVPADRLEEVAAIVSAIPEVNHNYAREHRFNLWFVVAAASQERMRAALDEIERRSGLPVMDLPMLESYRLDLGFPLSWT